MVLIFDLLEYWRSVKFDFENQYLKIIAMNKDKTFIGQPILAQIIKLIPKQLINSAVQKHDCNKYYKTLPLRTHLISSLFGVLSYCSGLRELC